MPNPAPSLDTIFAAAIEIADPNARAAYLAQACGPDAAFRRRVEALVRAHFKAGDAFLACPIVPAAADDTAAFHHDGDGDDGAIPAGTVIGPYHLREQIGTGGMGVVYVAEQLTPVRRKVALKVIKPGMDSRQVVARFEAERQALALMDHPHIARVFDGGLTRDGRPYFVMELVKGEPITDHCDGQRLTIRDRLGLFVQVCRAVQHAHQKGVIHRDIKPTNVLVAVHDVTAVAKVIDFGIAKSVGQELTDKTVYTAFAQMIGTPLYMSPEQAGQSSLDVDTRTDVFSLGVLLYELLTGTTPVDPDTFRQAGLDEVRRVIREDEPPRPSARMSTLDAVARTTAADCRRADPRKLAAEVRGELDWVVMKCLEKDRDRRYESAAALAADIERYLADESVLACPPSAGYRMRKFVRRYRRGVLTAAAVAAALLTGTAVSVWQAVSADAARKLADERAENEARAHREADAQRARAEANFQKAVEAVDGLLTRVGEEGLREVPQMEMVRRTILEDALKFYRGFLAERTGDTVLRGETAVALQRVGNISADLGRREEAVAAYEEAITIFRTLHRENPDNGLYRFFLSTAYSDLAWHTDLPAAAKEQYHTRAVELLRPLVAVNPVDYTLRGFRVRSVLANGMRSHAGLLLLRGELDQAEKAITEAISLLQDDQNWGRDVMAGCYLHLAQIHDRRGQFAEAVRACEKGIVLREGVVQANPMGFYRWELADDLWHLGHYLVKAGRLANADDVYRRACEIADPLVADFPSTASYRRVANLARTAWVPVLLKLGRKDDAARTLVAVLPQTADEYLARASGHRTLGSTDKELADLSEAIRLDPKLVAAYEKRVELSANQNAWQRVIADVDTLERLGPVGARLYKRLADAHFHLGDFPKALAGITKAVEGNPSDASNLLWINPADVSACPDAAFRQGMIDQATRAIDRTQGSPEVFAARAALFVALKDNANARDDCAKAAAGFRRQAEAQVGKPERDATLMSLAGVQALLGHSQLDARLYTEAEPILRECLATREKLSPDNWLRFNAMCLLGGALLGQGKSTEAEPLLIGGYEGMKQRENQIPQHGQLRLRESVERLVQLYESTNRPDKAREWTAKRPREVAPQPRPAR